MLHTKLLLNCELRNIFVFDEGHRLFSPVRAERADLGEPIAFQAVRTIRKRGVGLIIGDQVPHLLPQVVRSNVGTRIILRLVDGNSIRAMGDSLSLTPEQKAFILELPKRHAIVQYSGYARPFLIQLPELDMSEPIEEGELDDRSRQISSIPGFCAEDGARQQETVEGKSKISRLAEPVSKEAIDYLEKICENIFMPITKRDRMLGKSGWKGNALREELINHGLIRLRRMNTYVRGGVITVSEITEKGYEFLDRLKVKYEKPRGKGGFEHRFWQYVIATWAHRHGYSAEIECYRNGKSVDVGLEVDGRKVACEIVISGEEKELFNLEKDLMVGWDEIWFCCGNSESTEKIGRAISGRLGGDRSWSVEFKPLHSFVLKT